MPLEQASVARCRTTASQSDMRAEAPAGRVEPPGQDEEDRDDGEEEPDIVGPARVAGGEREVRREQVGAAPATAMATKARFSVKRTRGGWRVRPPAQPGPPGRGAGRG